MSDAAQSRVLSAAQTALRYGPCAVAVSGGGDSVALLRALAQCAATGGGRLWAVTVDHDLRPDSATEAAFVAQICAGLGVPHQTLIWQHGKITGNLMQEARLARRRLMADWAVAQGIACIALGHTADDQAEGLLMGLQRAAGLDGVSGMSQQVSHAGVVWARPFLGLGRLELRAWLGQIGQTWVEDPSNENDRFTRIRMRRVLGQMEDAGVGAAQIARSMRHLAAARSELNWHLSQFVQAHVTEVAGALMVPRGAFDALHPETQRRFVQAAAVWIGGADHAPRAAKVAQFQRAMTEGRAATLAGMRLRVRLRELLLSREPSAARGAVPMGQVWDRRWGVEGPLHGIVRALGAEGLAQRPGWRSRGIPRDALVSSPGIWDGTRLIAAPMLENGDYRAGIRLSFISFLNTH